MHEFVDKYQVGKTIPDLDSRLLALAIRDLVEDYDRFVLNCESHRGLLSWNRVSQEWLKILLADRN